MCFSVFRLAIRRQIAVSFVHSNAYPFRGYIILSFNGFSPLIVCAFIMAVISDNDFLIVINGHQRGPEMPFVINFFLRLLQPGNNLS